MKKILLSALSGALVAAAFSYPQFSFLIWFSLAPFIYVLFKSSFRQGIVSSVIFYFFYYGYTMFWINHVTTLGFFLLMAYLSLYGAVYFFITRIFRLKALRLITFPSAWVLVELAKEIIWPYCGWAQLGYSQFQNIYFIQIADIGGVKMISWVIVMVNVLLAESLIRPAKGVRLFSRSLIKKYLFAVVVIIFCLAYSFFRINTIETPDFKKVAVLQMNVPEVFKYNHATKDIVIGRLVSLGKKTHDEALVISPEAAWPFIVDEASMDEVREAVKAIGRDIVIGAVRAVDGRYFNSALFFAKDGGLRDAYYKIKLVPYGEYIPLRKYLGFISAVNEIGDMRPGSEKRIFTHEGSGFSTLICFEDSFPLFVREQARDSDFLINITNDGWFYGRPETLQHLSIMVLRAVENRRSIVRSANTGISGWVSPVGKFIALEKDGRRDYFLGQETFSIALTRQRSLYSVSGESFSLACFGFLLIFLFIKRKR
jgi:apolipoprotein N-acyltransferase